MDSNHFTTVALALINRIGRNRPANRIIAKDTQGQYYPIVDVEYDEKDCQLVFIIVKGSTN